MDSNTGLLMRRQRNTSHVCFRRRSEVAEVSTLRTRAIVWMFVPEDTLVKAPARLLDSKTSQVKERRNTFGKIFLGKLIAVKSLSEL